MVIMLASNVGKDGSVIQVMLLSNVGNPANVSNPSNADWYAGNASNYGNPGNSSDGGKDRNAGTQLIQVMMVIMVRMRIQGYS